MLLGNRRFGPPEGYVSQAGEVYSTALVLIRIFEEFRSDVASGSYRHRGRDRTARGIELHRQTHGVTASPTDRIRDFFHFAIGLSGTEQKEIHAYIQDLILDLYNDIQSKNPHVSKTELSGVLRDLGILLKEMTHDTPSLRPPMREVKERFEAIKTSLNQLLSPPSPVAREETHVTPLSDAEKEVPTPLSESSFGSDRLPPTPTLVLRPEEIPTAIE